MSESLNHALIIEMEPIDPTKLPLPSGSAEDTPLEFKSLIFEKGTRHETLQLSGDAVTPLWLKPKMYTKLQAPIEIELKEIDMDKLDRELMKFGSCNKHKDNAPLQQEVMELKAEAFMGTGLSPTEAEVAAHKLMNLLNALKAKR